MALTKIKTGGITDSAITTAKINNDAVTDAKVVDAITVTGAQTGITQVGTLSSLTTKNDLTLKDESGAENRFLFDVGGAGDNPKFIVYNNDGSTQDFKIDNGTITSVSGATFAGQVLVPDGSASTPSISNDGDGNTGLYFNAADEISITLGGTQLWRYSGQQQGALQGANPGYPAYSFATDWNTGMYLESADTLAFSTGGTKRLNIDSSGNATFSGTITSSADMGSSRDTGMNLISSNSSGYGFAVNFQANDGADSDRVTARLYSEPNDSNTSDFRILTRSGGTLSNRFIITGANANVSGKFGVGTAPSYALDVETDVDSWTQRLKNVHGNAYGLFINRSGGSGSANTDRKYMQCEDDSAVRLIIYSNGNVVNANNSYGSTSDKRIKNSIADASSQWDDIKALKIRKFKKNEAGENAPYHIGVIAQELETSGMNGLVDESPAMEDQIRNNKDINEGDSVKSVKTSVLYMKALKALQEAMIKIETLESKVSVLENA